MPLVCLSLLHWQQACAEHIEQFKLFVSAKIAAIVCDVPAHLFACKGVRLRLIWMHLIV